MTTSGQFTDFPIDSTGKNTNQNPRGIVTGPDGACWFAENGDAKIGRMTTSGQVTEYTVQGNPVDIADGPDGRRYGTPRTSGASWACLHLRDSHQL